MADWNSSRSGPLELALKFERMLMEHHHIFSLDKNKIGCTDTAEHIIELMDDEPFKERFRRIAPPLLEEVRDAGLRMPYGLCNAPATFQRLMQNCLGELNLTYALVYLDDVIVYSKMEEDHLRRLQAMFERFHEHGLKLKPSKCRFLRKQITCLGHEVSADGMMPGNLNLKGIAEMAPPANYMEVRHFLGMTGFFRRFIKNYARIAKPLNDILEGEASKLKSEAVTLPPDALDAFKKA